MRRQGWPVFWAHISHAVDVLRWNRAWRRPFWALDFVQRAIQNGIFYGWTLERRLKQEHLRRGAAQ